MLNEIIVFAKLTIDENIKNVLLATNPRYLSPTFNTFLYQKKEDLNLYSLSNFASNYIAEQLPNSLITLQNVYNGKINMDYFCIVTSFFDQVLIV